MRLEIGINRIGTIITEATQRMMVGHTRREEADVIRILKHPEDISLSDIRKYREKIVKISIFLVCMGQVEGAIKFAELSAINPHARIVEDAEQKAKNWKLNVNA